MSVFRTNTFSDEQDIAVASTLFELIDLVCTNNDSSRDHNRNELSLKSSQDPNPNLDILSDFFTDFNPENCFQVIQEPTNQPAESLEPRPVIPSEKLEPTPVIPPNHVEPLEQGQDTVNSKENSIESGPQQLDGFADKGVEQNRVFTRNLPPCTPYAPDLREEHRKLLQNIEELEEEEDFVNACNLAQVIVREIQNGICCIPGPYKERTNALYCKLFSDLGSAPSACITYHKLCYSSGEHYMPLSVKVLGKDVRLKMRVYRFKYRPDFIGICPELDAICDIVPSPFDDSFLMFFVQMYSTIRPYCPPRMCVVIPILACLLKYKDATVHDVYTSVARIPHVFDMLQFLMAGDTHLASRLLSRKWSAIECNWPGQKEIKHCAAQFWHVAKFRTLFGAPEDGQCPVDMKASGWFEKMEALYFEKDPRSEKENEDSRKLNDLHAKERRTSTKTSNPVSPICVKSPSFSEQFIQLTSSENRISPLLPPNGIEGIFESEVAKKDAEGDNNDSKKVVGEPVKEDVIPAADIKRGKVGRPRKRGTDAPSEETEKLRRGRPPKDTSTTASSAPIPHRYIAPVNSAYNAGKSEENSADRRKRAPTSCDDGQNNEDKGAVNAILDESFTSDGIPTRNRRTSKKRRTYSPTSGNYVPMNQGDMFVEELEVTKWADTMQTKLNENTKKTSRKASNTSENSKLCDEVFYPNGQPSSQGKGGNGEQKTKSPRRPSVAEVMQMRHLTSQGLYFSAPPPPMSPMPGVGQQMGNMQQLPYGYGYPLPNMASSYYYPTGLMQMPQLRPPNVLRTGTQPSSGPLIPGNGLTVHRQQAPPTPRIVYRSVPASQWIEGQYPRGQVVTSQVPPMQMNTHGYAQYQTMNQGQQQRTQLPPYMVQQNGMGANVWPQSNPFVDPRPVFAPQSQSAMYDNKLPNAMPQTQTNTNRNLYGDQTRFSAGADAAHVANNEADDSGPPKLIAEHDVPSASCRSSAHLNPFETPAHPAHHDVKHQPSAEYHTSTVNDSIPTSFGQATSDAYVSDDRARVQNAGEQHMDGSAITFSGTDDSQVDILIDTLLLLNAVERESEQTNSIKRRLSEVLTDTQIFALLDRGGGHQLVGELFQMKSNRRLQ